MTGAEQVDRRPAALVPVVSVRAAPPDARARRTAGWVVTLVLMAILLQRFATPGQHLLALLWPVMIVWTAAGLWRGVLEVDPRRLALWCVAETVTGLAILVQSALLASPFISLNSWLLFTFVWLPAVVRLRDRRLATYRLSLQWSVRAFTGLAVGCVVMMASQLAGLRYHDWFADVVPNKLQLSPYAITYPLTFGSPIYKSNAWIGLEPSFISFQLGLGILAALLVRSGWRTLLVLFAGLGTAASGSGFLILLVGVLAILLSEGRRSLLRYLVPIAVAAVALLLTPIGQDLLGRADEAGTTGSSASLRSVLPYQVLWQTWISNGWAAVLGRGPGSSQNLTEGSGIAGLLVPTPAKIIFDYGLVAGFVLAMFLVFCYLEGPSLSMAATLFFSLWAVQPGNQPLTVIPVLAFVTLWAPRIDRRAEDVLDQSAFAPPFFRRPALLR